MTFECSLMGSITVWEGTAFHCENSGNEIILLHSKFNDEGGTHATCNNGAIKGRSLRTEGRTYTSQLVVSVSSEMILGESIVCSADDGTDGTQVGGVTLATTTGQLNLFCHSASQSSSYTTDNS